MLRESQAPTVTIKDDRTVYEHPAFGQIAVFRVSSGGAGTYLYGSDFGHNNYIMIEVKRSSMERHLSRDWFHNHDEIVRLCLSEAQWATFVSAVGLGSGVPCTIEHVTGEWIPGLPQPDTTSHFKNEVRSKMQRSVERLKSLQKKVADGVAGLPKSKQAALLEEIRASIQDIEQNLPFVADSFDEHVEETIEKVKVEANAYMQAMVTRAGLEALAGGTAPLQLGFDAGSEPEAKS